MFSCLALWLGKLTLLVVSWARLLAAGLEYGIAGLELGIAGLE